MRQREVYGNSLFIQIMWVSLLDRSLGWETSNGGEEEVGGGGGRLFNTLKTLFLLSSQDMTLLKFAFRCLVLRGSADCQLLKLFLFSSPATKDLRICVSDARLHQLQHWLQLLIKLLAVKGQKC